MINIVKSTQFSTGIHRLRINTTSWKLILLTFKSWIPLHCSLKLLNVTVLPCWTSRQRNREEIPRADYETQRIFWTTRDLSRFFSDSKTLLRRGHDLRGQGVFADSLGHWTDFSGWFRDFFCGGTEGPLFWISHALHGVDPAMQKTRFKFEFWILCNLGRIFCYRKN